MGRTGRGGTGRRLCGRPVAGSARQIWPGGVTVASAAGTTAVAASRRPRDRTSAVARGARAGVTAPSAPRASRALDLPARRPEAPGW